MAISLICMAVRHYSFLSFWRALKMESSCTSSNRIPLDPKPLLQIQVSQSIKNSENVTNISGIAKVVSYDERCMTCKSGTVTWTVKSLAEIIVISDDQLKSQENNE